MTDIPTTQPQYRTARRSRWLLRAASLLALAALWEAYARQARSLLLPTFSSTVLALSRLLIQPQTWRAAWLSNQALGLGFLLSAAAGVPLGLLLGRSARISAFADLYLDTLLVPPMSPLLPLFILATGLGLTSRVLFIVAFSVVPIIINTKTGIRQVDPALIDMARSFGASEMQLWRKVLLPAALPEVVAGLQVALGRAIAGMVVVELLLTAVGFGRLILEAQADFDADVVYALIVIVACEALLLMALVQRLQRRTGTRGTEAWA